MTKRRWWLGIGGIVLAAAAATVALSVAFGGGGSSGKPGQAVTAQPIQGNFESLWQHTRVGESQAVVLGRWPKDFYQHYSDNLKDDCYEWMGTNLYNLCFKDGVLRSKELL